MAIVIRKAVELKDLAGLSEEHKKAISKLAAAVQPMVVGLLAGGADKAAALDLLGKGEITTVAYMEWDKLFAGKPAFKKTVCLVTPAEFLTDAGPLAITLGEELFTAIPKVFSTGGLGWNHQGKITRSIAGRDVKCQVSLNISVIGSNDTADAAAHKAAVAAQRAADELAKKNK